ncbi:hypothetical protein SARC_12635 [Sphaeroforma arctica JP610]|uniref:Alpha-ketoglutarate-dependent dioxygenase FTO catalytic domain-containing protein n=1 Tax=Sphaeroforma arctica JP610 TaxID=667725 RepID=A0A0L0FDI9_9EUKA|nr:hypothetical protein SARC_12635 [Sphaeroforma arctica JP610]KNC74827.1 hypothetical protein SARC_12635 [Sphaeroforma arctica JP610]|eukprot:XP_014148729.1 hypothetical protein SARC_12635 [Sphaeroforma arctica JP610]
MASNWAKLQQQIVCNPKKKQKSTGVVQGKTIGNINNGSKKTAPFHKKTQSGIIRDTAASTPAINPDISSGKRKLKVDGNECSKGNKRKKIHQQTSFPTDVPTTQVNNQQNNTIQNGRGDATQITSSTRHIDKQLETSQKKSKKKIKHKQAQIQSRKNDKSRSDCTHIEVSSNSQLPISATKAPTPFTIQANTCHACRKFTTPQDCVCTKGSKKESVCVNAFKQCMAHSYRGFSRTSAEKIESSLHDSILDTLDDMVKKNYFHYDIVSAGKAVCRQYVFEFILYTKLHVNEG